MELLVVRHAQPEHAKPEHGPADPSLTGSGRNLAASLADWIARNPARLPDRIISSPMRRAQETAAAIAVRTGIRVELDPRIAEFDLGAKEYVPLEQAGKNILDQAEAALQIGKWGTHVFDPEAFRARVRAGFDDIIRDSESKRIVVVCHGGVLNSWLSWVVGREHGVFFMPRYTSVSRVFVTADRRLRLASLNELPHAEGLYAGQGSED